jgi:selenium-binding protein 1
MLDPPDSDKSGRGNPDAITVVDSDDTSDRYGSIVGWTDLPTTGDELHHFGWNACSSGAPGAPAGAPSSRRARPPS